MALQPLLLLHGMGCGPWVWRNVLAAMPTVSAHAVTLAGHRGGADLDQSSGTPATEQMVDDLERQLDEAGIERAHIVGNSLGGWLALRLSERGRALSVLGLAPAGGWIPGSPGEATLIRRFAMGRQVARMVNRTPLLLQSSAMRHALLHPVVSDRSAYTVGAARLLLRDLAQCQAIEIAIHNEETRRMSTIKDLGAPTKIVWSERDRILSGNWARTQYADLQADFSVLARAGHMPMLDDPAAVAGLITAQMA